MYILCIRLSIRVSLGLVRTVGQRCNWTLTQCSNNTQLAVEREVLHAIYPRRDYEVDRIDARNKQGTTARLRSSTSPRPTAIIRSKPGRGKSGAWTALRLPLPER